MRSPLGSLLLLFLTPAALVAQEYQLDPRSTFLTTDTNPADPAQPPRVVDLASLGYLPGQHLRLRVVGDFQWHPTNPALQGTNAVAVFSATSTVLPTTNQHRVPQALLCNAPAYVTATTFNNALVTDIPQDFLVTGAGTSVTIPDNGSGSAPFLMLGADDVYWSDNVDPENDFFVILERPVDAELLRNGGFEVSSMAGWSVTSGSFGILSYGTSTTPVGAVSSAIQGGNRLVRGNPNSQAQQSFDLSGNAAAIDAGGMFVELSGYFGGYFDHSYWAALEAVFENAAGGSTGGTVGVGYIERHHRNYQTTVMHRRGVFAIPPGTRVLRIRLNVQLGHPSHVIFADNLSAKLRTSGIPAALPTDSELLDNGGFETGNLINPALASGWTVTSSSSFALTTYAGSNMPAASVSSAIQGGNYLVRANPDAQVQQWFDVSGNAAAIDAGGMFVELSGYFGGYFDHSYWAALEAVFENAAGGSTGGTVGVGYIERHHRNYQTTVMHRRGVFAIPPGTRVLRIRLNVQLGHPSHVIFADNLSAKLRTSGIPAALPTDSELLDNGGFETGNLINPALASGWTVTSSSSFALTTYAGSNMPAASVSSAIQGGNYLVRANPDAQVQQWFDVSGNAAAIDAGGMFVELSGYFGGYFDHSYWAALEAVFENAAGGSTGGTVGVGYIERHHRNYQTTVMHRRGVFAIPPGTRVLRIRLNVQLGHPSHIIFADNLSAKLRTSGTPSALPLGAEMIDNGGFESGQVVNPTAATGWYGYSGTTTSAVNYGAPDLPPPSVANTIGGGTWLGRANGGTSEFAQTFNVAGNAVDIDAQNTAIRLAGWFGGITSNGGAAGLRAIAVSQFGGTLGSFAVGYVSPIDRGNVTTLLHRTGDWLLPYGTRTIHVVLHFTDGNGLADNLSAQLIDVTTPLRHPGTGDGLTLLTGVNAAPSGGPRADLKTALPGNVLTLHVTSPNGRYHGAPLFFAGNAFMTGGGVPGPGIPGLHVNPYVAGYFWLLNGVTPIGPLGSPVVVPGGVTMSFLVPPGLAGGSVLLQALTLSTNSANSVYTTTDAHEIRFL